MACQEASILSRQNASIMPRQIHIGTPTSRNHRDGFSRSRCVSTGRVRFGAGGVPLGVLRRSRRRAIRRTLDRCPVLRSRPVRSQSGGLVGRFFGRLPVSLSRSALGRNVYRFVSMTSHVRIGAETTPLGAKSAALEPSSLKTLARRARAARHPGPDSQHPSSPWRATGACYRLSSIRCGGQPQRPSGVASCPWRPWPRCERLC